MRRILVSVAVVVGLAACGIQRDASYRDVPDDEWILPNSGSNTASDASGADRIYLIGPGEDRLLRSVARNAESPEDLIKILFLGPNDDELAAQFSSNIPPGTELQDARAQGQFLILDLSEEITELTPQSLAPAIAQIVYTATELEGIEAVQLTVNGEELSWPTPSGETTTDPLQIYDYPNVVQTAQPAYPAVPLTPDS